ncbi:MAG: hypothetical protein Fur0023_17690 [Bacteroidia bacterium]
MFTSLYKTGVTFYYLINKKYIENNLCINKDNLALNCHGKCYLSVSVNKHNADSGDSYILKHLVNISDREYFQESIIMEYVMTVCCIVATGFLENYQYLYEYSYFHPPTVC